MTTKASISYLKFKFEKRIQYYLVVRVLECLKVFTNLFKTVLKIPMNGNTRSLNIASSVAIVLAESLRQTKLI